MLAICAYYAGIMLNAFAAYYAHNYAGIIGSSLLLAYSMTMCLDPFIKYNVHYNMLSAIL